MHLDASFVSAKTFDFLERCKNCLSLMAPITEVHRTPPTTATTKFTTSRGTWPLGLTLTSLGIRNYIDVVDN